MNEPVVRDRVAPRILSWALAAVVATTFGCGGKGGGEGAEIPLRFPAGASADPSVAAAKPRARAIANLASLPRPEGGAALVAAAEFEPAGLRIPGGVEATWRLGTLRVPGERLWIAMLEEWSGRWLGTGETAKVSASGMEATGRLYHFSTGGLLDREPAAKEGDAGTGGGVAGPGAGGMDAGAGMEDEEEKGPSPRFKRSPWKFVNVFAETRDLRKFDGEARKEAAKKVREKLAAVGQGDDYRPIGDLFRDHPFEDMGPLARPKRGTPSITPAESKNLALARREMINQAMAEAVKALDPDGRLTIGMLDSGNKNSGITSDVDQTVFVIPKDVAARMSPPVTEADVMKKFKAAFVDRFKVDPARLGITTLNGADFYPDWRQKHTVASFVEEADRVVDEKRKDKNAYRSEGQLKSQAEGRGYEALQQHHKRVSDLKSARDAIDSIRRDRRLSAAEKTARIDEVTRRTLDAHKEKHPASSLDDLEKKFKADSPWTEVRIDPTTKKPVVSQVEDPKSKVLAQKPEFARRFAFDGAWDNGLMFESHPADRMKYLLRSVSEGISLVRKHPPGKALTAFEYEKAYAAGDRAAMAAFVDDVYGHKPPEVRERYRKALDAAARDRVSHKAGETGGKTYSEKEVLSAYWPLIDEKEAKVYEGMSREAVDAMLADRARRAWEADAREIMMENLLRTVPAAGGILDGKVTAAEIARIKQSFPSATPEKLTAAVKRQLYQGFRDLMSSEYAQHLVSPEGRPPPAHDLVHRLLTEMQRQNPAVAEEIRKIALDAAAFRVTNDPGQKTFRQAAYEYLKSIASERIAAAADVYRTAKKNYAEGKYTKEYVAQAMIRSTAERWGSMKAQVARSFGFDVTNVHLLLPEKGLPRVELEFGPQKWRAQEALKNFACMGNVDSVLQVALAYQQGTAEDAAWAAAFEVAMNVPGVAQANAVKDLVVHGRPEGVVMLGSAMLVPGLGQAFLVISIAKTSVMLLGNAVFQPLKNDDADNLYQGFLAGEDPATIRSRSQRANLLHHVPLRVAVLEVKGPDGKVTAVPLWAPYSREEAVSRLGAFPEEVDELAKDGVLGGGPEWEAQAAVARDFVNHPREHFEAQRASMAHHYRAKFGEGFLEVAADDPERAMPRLVKFFDDRIEDWVNARGEFANFPENTLLARRFEVSKHLDASAVRLQVAQRAASDLIRSLQIVTAVEDGIRQQIEARREGERRFETNARLTAIDEAWREETDGDLTRAVRDVVHERREEGREPEPRVHVFSRLVPAGKPEKPGDEPPVDVEFDVSVVADPAVHPPLSYDGETAVYDVAVDWTIAEKGKGTRDVTAKVTVRDANKAVVGKPVDVRIGTVEKEKSRPEGTNLKVSFWLKGASQQNLPPAKEGRIVTTWGEAVEDFEASKAESPGDRWGGEEVTRLRPELWIVWEDAPVEAIYAYDLVVSGGAAGYEKKYAEGTYSRDRFPGEPEPTGGTRKNLFVLPFEWPAGHVGAFTVRGKLHALKDAVPVEKRATAEALGRYDIEATFAIPDRREASGARFVLRTERKVPVGEVDSFDLTKDQKEQAKKYAKDGIARVTVVEDYDEAESDVFLKKWGEEPIGWDKPRGQPNFELHVRWKDVPQGLRYAYELEVKGGIPSVDEKRGETIEPTIDFAPKPYRSGPGSTAFTVPVSWPYRGGTVALSGRLLALPKKATGTDWRKETPVATYPFEHSFRVKNRSRAGEGLIDYWGAKPFVKVLLENVQSGKRPVSLTAGGRTTWVMLPESYGRQISPFLDRGDYSFGADFGFGMGIVDKVTVSFMDFGERATLDIALKPERNPLPPLDTPNPTMIAYEKEALAKIARWSAVPKPGVSELDAIPREYDSLVGHWRPFDYAKSQRYARLADEGWRRLREFYLAGTKDPKKQAEERAVMVQDCDGEYWGAVAWHDPAMVGLFSQAVACVQGTGADAPEVSRQLSYLYRNHAENLFRLTGDLAGAADAWTKYVEHNQTASGPKFGDASKEPNPWVIAPMFR